MIDQSDLLWKNISELPYFRGFLRAIEGKFYQDFILENPILDLGCGDGHFTSRTLPKNLEVLGIDPSLKILLKAKKYGFYQALVCADAANLPFKNSSFQTTISNSVLEHIPDLGPVLMETHRIMKVRGFFYACFPNNNFSENLSIAIFLEKIHLHIIAEVYRVLFNKISRHFHTKSIQNWKKTFENSGFFIQKAWNYFDKPSLRILEWGHLFGLPNWVNHVLTGNWVLVNKNWNPILFLVYKWLLPKFSANQVASEGAYSFIIAENI